MMLRRAISVALLSLMSLPAVTRADSGTYDNFHCYVGTLQTIKHSDTNTSSVGVINGTVRAATSGEIFDGMSTQCTLLLGQQQGSVYGQGYCEWFDADNDRLFFHFERVGAGGKVRSVSGTGKYQRVSMEGTYEVGRFAQTPGLLR